MLKKSDVKEWDSRNILLISFTFLCFCLLFILPPIPQNIEYHSFADKRTFLGIPNFLNVVSNIPFILFGVIGFLNLYKKGIGKEGPYLAYFIFLISVIGIGIGSAFYHLYPNNQTLVYDRLPMTGAFMSFLSITIYCIISRELGKFLLIPFLLLGLASVLLWYYGEMNGNGDLRLYVLVQFYPMVAIPLIVFIYPSSKSFKKGLLFIIAWYAIAKLFEIFDEQIYKAGEVISGHTLKHIFAGITIWKITSVLSSIVIGETLSNKDGINESR